ncbi:UbiA family prenyltransferase [Niabella ginsengisoli]|uniref:UbiA family prenyltransferase n=1 Tax=Niabella ginsengisoli TaxID=522298 RepID=A0ABS9SGY5_9BACT|nr:UbiA family prenyltransferase [Niabella ginsengisoli]
MLLILLSLVVGAGYVSIINDITDIDDDLAAGKTNRMASASKTLRFVLPFICILIGVSFIVFFYWPDYLSCIFYLIPWILFSMYSFRPIRLKNRGILGVFADAGGSHIFTSLLMVSSMYFAAGKKVDYFWLLLVSIWALCYGMRGILWHQFHDRNNDIRSGIQTFATKRQPANFRSAERIIFTFELLATIGILLKLNNLICYLGGLIYVILILLRYKRLNLYPLIIIEPNRPYQIMMLDFMQAIFPLSLLLFAAFTQPKGWIVLVVHFVLFPFKTIQILKDLKHAILK